MSPPLFSRKTYTLVATLLIAASTAFAQPSKPPRNFAAIALEDGRVLEQVRILSQTPSYAMVKHSKGVENIPFATMPPAIQTALGYDPQAEIAHQKAQAARQEKAAQIRNQNQANLGRKLAEINPKPEPPPTKAKDTGTKTLVGKVISVTEEGLIIECKNPSNYIVRSRSSSIGGGGRTYSPPVTKYRYKREYGSFYLSGHPDHARIADNDRIEIEATREGAFSYTAIDNSRTTLPEFRYQGKASPLP